MYNNLGQKEKTEFYFSQEQDYNMYKALPDCPAGKEYYYTGGQKMKGTKIHHRLLSAVSALLLTFTLCSVIASAEEQSQTSESSGTLQRYYFDDNLVNTGLDTGYSQKDIINKDDPHFGWELGKFNLTGYTRVTDEDSAQPIFLKNVGDKLTLWFKLDQNIDKLDGDENKRIADDSNGYDEYFGVKETNFGRGTLIVRHSDYQNKNQKPVIYEDYLNSKAQKGTDTKVELFEEGDYEVALDYEIETKSKVMLITKTNYTNYRISFRFSVRNGNCMVYPFDVKTKEELTNTSITPNGFYLDLAKSRYLDINIKKEVLKEGAEGLSEDVRFNAPAKDGNKYTSEGIYTISVKNKYTDQQTEKKIYVGDDNLLKAYMTTGLSIREIQNQVKNGAEINDDGTIVTVSKQALSPTSSKPEEVSEIKTKAASTAKAEPPADVETISKQVQETPEGDNSVFILIGTGCFILIAAVSAALIVIMKSRKKTDADK